MRLGLILFALLTGSALAHDAPTGWAYDGACCSNKDCRAVSSSAIEEGPASFTIRATGEWIAADSPKIRQSQDEDFHWCSIGGRDDGRTLCLYVPNRGF